MDTDQFRLNRYLMSSAATGVALAFAMTGPVYAQEATDTPVTVEEVEEAAEEAAEEAEARQDTIVVTGIRASLERSAALKRNAGSIVEAISAEDIGKLPDVSIAESLARLPGLAAQRLRGRAQVISVRGLGPDFTTALLNGREQVTAGDNRAVEFDQFPSELLSSVVVYKTPEASLLGQGLAGTADLRTIRPLSYDDRLLVGSARYEYNDQGALNAGSNDDGYRFTGTYVDQFADDTVGIVLAAAFQNTPTQAERFDAWGYPTTGDGDLIIGGSKPYVESRELERTAVVGTLEFEPTPTLSSSVDLFYSEFEDSGVLRGIELPLFWSGAQLQPGFSVENGLVTEGIFNGVQGVVRNDFRGRDAELFSGGWNLAWSPIDQWTFEGDISYSRVERNDVDLETYSGTGAGFGNGASDNLAFQSTGSGFVFGSQLDYADPNTILLTDPQGWGQVGFIKEPSSDDELTAIRASATRDFDAGVITSVEAGVNYTQREKERRSEEAFLDLANPSAEGTTPIPANLLQGPTSLSFIGIQGQVSYDPIALLNSGVYSLRPNTNPDVVTKAWDVQEDVATFYAQANIGTELGGLPLTGNVGFQVINTDQASQGAAVGRDPDGVIQIVRVDQGEEYTEVLPAANFSLELAENRFLRFSAARTLARARLDQIRASQEFGVDTSLILFPGELAADPTATSGVDIASGRAVFTPGGGNPFLRPYLANAFDISLEQYFGNGGYISAAIFYKDLQDFVFDGARSEVDYSAIVDEVPWIDPVTLLPVSAAEIRALNPGIDTGILSQPENGEGGYLQGIELSASLPGSMFLPEGPLDGFGVQASISFTDSEITPQDEPEPIAIPGLSETVGNISLYYEKAGFEARVSNRYRSEFLGEVTGFGAGREFRDVKSESVVDAQIGYEFETGRFEGLTIQLQANNLTDEEFATFLNDDERQIKDYQSYGTSYLLGVTYRR